MTDARHEAGFDRTDALDGAAFIQKLWHRVPDLIPGRPVGRARLCGIADVRILENVRTVDYAPPELFVDTGDALAALVDIYTKERACRGVGAFFGVCPRGYNSGKKEAVAAVPALWVDLDTENNKWSKTGTIAALDLCEIRPSAIVDSGRGLHLYWLLENPIVLDDYADREAVIAAVETLNRGLARVFHGDKVHNVDRILRIPGTYNTKEAVARPVQVVQATWYLYDFDALADTVDATSAALVDGTWLGKTAIAERHRAIAASNQGSALAAAAAVALGGRRGGKPMSAAQIWQHTRYGGDRERFGGAGSAWLGIDEAITRATCWYWMRFGGDDLEASVDDDWIVDTVIAQVRGIQQRDAPHERWDWDAERRSVVSKLARWKPKWHAVRLANQPKPKTRVKAVNP